jgi:hypothetical protein
VPGCGRGLPGWASAVAAGGRDDPGGGAVVGQLNNKLIRCARRPLIAQGLVMSTASWRPAPIVALSIASAGAPLPALCPGRRRQPVQATPAGERARRWPGAGGLTPVRWRPGQREGRRPGASGNPWLEIPPEPVVTVSHSCWLRSAAGGPGHGDGQAGGRIDISGDYLERRAVGTLRTCRPWPGQPPIVTLQLSLSSVTRSALAR